MHRRGKPVWILKTAIFDGRHPASSPVTNCELIQPDVQNRTIACQVAVTAFVLPPTGSTGVYFGRLRGNFKICILGLG